MKRRDEGLPGADPPRTLYNARGCRLRHTPAARSLLAVGIAAGIGVIGAGCDLFDHWDALVYSNRYDAAHVIDLGTFDSLEECRAAALAKLRAIKGGPLSGYVCGQNCSVKLGFSPMRMCAHTSK